MPKDQIDAADQIDEIFNYLQQSNISSKNMERLSELANSSNAEISARAAIVLEIGKVKPHKKARLKYLARNHRHLLKKLEDTGLIMAQES